MKAFDPDLVARMRDAFDRGFAAPPPAATDADDAFLAIRIGGRAFALAVRDVAGLARDRKIVSVPSPVAELLGLAGVRGELVPVYGLAASLGLPAEPAPSWLALCGDGARVGLAFAELEGQIRRPRERVLAGGGEHVRGWLETEGAARAVLDAGSIVEALKRRAAAARASKER
jgi:chemotaxis signal transduction protein